MEECCILFEVWTEFLNTVLKSFSFKGLIDELLIL
jgi:hypothetical protein